MISIPLAAVPSGSSMTSAGFGIIEGTHIQLPCNPDDILHLDLVHFSIVREEHSDWHADFNSNQLQTRNLNTALQSKFRQPSAMAMRRLGQANLGYLPRTGESKWSPKPEVECKGRALGASWQGRGGVHHAASGATRTCTCGWGPRRCGVRHRSAVTGSPAHLKQPRGFDGRSIPLRFCSAKGKTPDTASTTGSCMRPLRVAL